MTEPRDDGLFYRKDLEDAFKDGFIRGLQVAINAARCTPFRAHAEDDMNYHSGCEQTKRRILDAILAVTYSSPSSSCPVVGCRHIGPHRHDIGGPVQNKA
jgi:hypothetical protein